MSETSAWTPEYGAEYSGQPLWNTCISLAILETVFVAAFMLSWYFNTNAGNKHLKPVMYLILVGYILCFGVAVIGLLEILLGGAGYRIDTLPPTKVRVMFQLVKAHEAVYASSILFPKLATLYLYFRLFASKIIQYIIYATCFLVVATFLFGFIVAFLNCRPFASFWDRGIEARCAMDAMTIIRYYSIPNIITDAILLIIPLPALRRLRVKVVTKICIYLAFSAMALGVATAVLRFVSFLHDYDDIFDDITFLGISVTSWSIVEPGVCLMVAIIPTLRPLFRQFPNPATAILPVPNRASAHTKEMFRTPFFNPDDHGYDDETFEEPRRVLQHKTSSMSLQREFFGSDEHRPSRQIHLHMGRNMSVGSADEESLVCADAICAERFAKEGRNPDGTLRIWSLQPAAQLSPLRTSFVFGNKSS